MSALAYNIVIVPRAVEIDSNKKNIWNSRATICCICGEDKPTEVRLPEEQWEEFPDEPRIKHIDHKKMTVCSIGKWDGINHYNRCVCFTCIYIHGSFADTDECEEKKVLYQFIDVSSFKFTQSLKMDAEFAELAKFEGMFDDAMIPLNWLPKYPGDIESYMRYNRYYDEKLLTAQKIEINRKIKAMQSVDKKSEAVVDDKELFDMLSKKLVIGRTKYVK